MALLVVPSEQPFVSLVQAFPDSGSASITGTTTETTLYTYDIPAYVPGKNGRLVIETWWNATANANAKTPRIKAGATTILTGSLTTSGAFVDRRVIAWANNYSSQYTYIGSHTGGWHTAATALPTSLTMTGTAAITLTFTGQLADAGDTIRLVAVFIDGVYRN